MVLQSADASGLARGDNLALLGDEVIQFARAEQVASALWRLSRLTRGVGGSPAQAHEPGTRFVLLARESLLVVADGAVRLGDRVRVSAQGVGDRDERAGSETFLDGRSVAPLAPVHLRWTARPDGGATVSWTRRSRVGWRWNDGEVPLGEERETYRVVVSSKFGERVEMLAQPALTITPAEVAGGNVRVTVAQVGTFATSRIAVIDQPTAKGTNHE
ncbi:GTA baseplate fiber-binding domain-containing protein [Sphingomonas sp. Mn802worker]|uniref:GTA baseplate fiber-binding domain-containing protein n=1 Tax=Sphingomonas sp. Mn802worker TaxID=629773 RepID=UPI003FD2807C